MSRESMVEIVALKESLLPPWRNATRYRAWAVPTE